jgi:hypothetical protein
MNAIDGNGPVVEPTNFEMGIAGDMELGYWIKCQATKLIKI